MTLPAQSARSAIPWRTAAGGVGAVLGVMLLVSAGTQVAAFFDPCHTFGAGAEGSGSSTVPPSTECKHLTTTSETRAEAGLRLLWLHAIVIAASVLALTGAWTATARPLWVATALYAVELFPLGLSIYGVLALLASSICAAAAWSLRARQPEEV